MWSSDLAVDGGLDIDDGAFDLDLDNLDRGGLFSQQNSTIPVSLQVNTAADQSRISGPGRGPPEPTSQVRRGGSAFDFGAAASVSPSANFPGPSQQQPQQHHHHHQQQQQQQQQLWLSGSQAGGGGAAASQAWTGGGGGGGASRGDEVEVDLAFNEEEAAEEDAILASAAFRCMGEEEENYFAAKEESASQKLKAFAFHGSSVPAAPSSQVVVASQAAMPPALNSSQAILEEEQLLSTPSSSQASESVPSSTQRGQLVKHIPPAVSSPVATGPVTTTIAPHPSSQLQSRGQGSGWANGAAAASPSANQSARTEVPGSDVDDDEEAALIERCKREGPPGPASATIAVVSNAPDWLSRDASGMDGNNNINNKPGAARTLLGESPAWLSALRALNMPFDHFHLGLRGPTPHSQELASASPMLSHNLAAVSRGLTPPKRWHLVVLLRKVESIAGELTALVEDPTGEAIATFDREVGSLHPKAVMEGTVLLLTNVVAWRAIEAPTSISAPKRRRLWTSDTSKPRLLVVPRGVARYFVASDSSAEETAALLAEARSTISGGGGA